MGPPPLLLGRRILTRQACGERGLCRSSVDGAGPQGWYNRAGRPGCAGAVCGVEAGQGQGEHRVSQRLAADCRYLRRTIDAARADGPLVCLCQHPVRAGFDCVGPFLENLPTRCGLWEGVRLPRPVEPGETGGRW